MPFFNCILSVHIYETAMRQKMEADLVHRTPTEVANDAISIVQGYTDPQHKNGIACSWGGAILRFALMIVQETIIVKSTGKRLPVRQIGHTWGGSGHGSGHNTRVAYIGTVRPESDPNLLTHTPLYNWSFQFWEGHLFDYVINRMNEEDPIATTKVRHDSGVTMQDTITFLHEAKSTSVSEEMFKITVGLARILTTQKEAWALLSSKHDITFMRAELVIDSSPKLDSNSIRIETLKENYVTQITTGHEYIRNIMTIIQRVAAILQKKELVHEKITAKAASRRDNTQVGRSNFHPRRVPDYHAVFCTDPQYRQVLDPVYVANVMEPALRDLRDNRLPIRGGYSASGYDS